MTDVSHSGHLGESDGRDIGAGDGETARAIGDVLFVHFHHARSDLLCLRDNPERRDVDAGPADSHRARIEGAVARLHLSCVALHHVNIFDRHLQDIGGDLRKRSLVAVALAHRARVNRHPATRIHTYSGALPPAAGEAAQSQSSRWRHDAHMCGGSNANATISPCAPQLAARAAAPRVVERGKRLIETALVVAAVEDGALAIIWAKGKIR